MSNLETNTTDLQSILNKVRSLPAGGGSGVQPDWNQNDPDAADYIKNRPFYEITSQVDEITWDGNAEGYEYFEEEGMLIAKLSNTTPTPEQLIGGSIGGYSIGENFEDTIAEDVITDMRGYGVPIVIIGTVCIIAYEDTNLEGISVTKGTWFAKTNNGDGTPFMYLTKLKFTEPIAVSEIKHLDNKFLSFMDDGKETIAMDYLPEQLQIGESKGKVNSISFDGNPDGKEVITPGVEGTCYVKVSNVVPTKEQVVGSIGEFCDMDGNVLMSMTTTNDMIIDDPDIGFTIAIDYDGEKLPVVVVVNNDASEYSQGIYFILITGMGYVYKETFTEKLFDGIEIKKIDSKYIDLEWDTSPKTMTRTNIVPLTENVVSGAMLESLTFETLEPLNELAVIIDGVEYIDKVYISRDSNLASDDLILVGNVALMYPQFPSSPSPFLILAARSNTMLLVINGTSEDKNPHTIQIDGIVKTYESIPDHLLSENLRKTVGKSVAYEMTYRLSDTTTAKRSGSGAEIFNDYANNKAIGQNSHAEGSSTIAYGGSSHAEGSYTLASGNNSHAEGQTTTASGDYSHAEGSRTTASGSSSHAEGYQTIAKGSYQHVQGRYNIEDVYNYEEYKGYKYAHIVGNGDFSKRSNAHTLDWKGNAWFAGDVYVGGTSQNDALKLSPITEDTTEILSETTCTFNNAMSDGYSDTTVTLNTDFVVGEKYDVCWDGTWYCDLTARKIANERYIAGIVDGYNFGVLHNTSNGVYSVETYVAASGETHTIKVVQSKGVTATIDNKPIPLATKAYVEALEKEIAELRTLVQQLTNS